MKRFLIRGASSRLKGEIVAPGDKSIAHRAIIISAISQGRTVIENFPINKDCLSTIGAVKSLGVKVIKKKNLFVVFGKGLYGLEKPQSPVFIEESGTTFRLLLGLLCAQDFPSKLVAGPSLSKRPMLRVAVPLRMMGARVEGRRTALRRAKCDFGVNAKGISKSNDKGREEEYPPISIRESGKLSAIKYKMPVASAQVKSAIILAALYAQGTTEITEFVKTRDHTECMLNLFKGSISVKKNKVLVAGGRELVSPGKVYVPGDISSAAFFIVAGLILPGSKVLVRNVSLNPTRTGILKVLKRMKAQIRIRRSGASGSSGEAMGDLLVKSSSLIGTVVKRSEIPSLIDELPILMVAACFAEGRSVFQCVGELRVKETDRIESMVFNLRKLGADIRISKSSGFENIVIFGGGNLKGAALKSFGDHRTAMSMVIAGLAASGDSSIDDISCINKSFPEFLSFLHKLI